MIPGGRPSTYSPMYSVCRFIATELCIVWAGEAVLLVRYARHVSAQVRFASELLRRAGQQLGSYLRTT